MRLLMERCADEAGRAGELHVREKMPEPVKTCFVIGPIGEPLTDVYHRALALLERVIIPAITPFGHVIVRADQIPTSGLLHLQMAAQLIQADLVVADLTGANPNVYYELGIRHTLGKPCVQILPIGEHLPFDVASMRTIMIDDRSPAGIQAGIEAIQAQVRTLTTPLLTPVSVLVNVTTTVRDGALLQAASTIGTTGPVNRRPPSKPASLPAYRLEETAEFWESLEALAAASEQPVTDVVSALIACILAHPTNATFSNGVYVVRSRPALFNDFAVPGLRIAYTFADRVIVLVHLEQYDPLDDDSGAAIPALSGRNSRPH
jgi:nucleoside 2-deoxyribosyltransferase